MYFVSLVEVLWSDGCPVFCVQVKMKCLWCGISRCCRCEVKVAVLSSLRSRQTEYAKTSKQPTQEQQARMRKTGKGCELVRGCKRPTRDMTY